MNRRILIGLLMLLLTSVTRGQQPVRVGVVLSGGGAKGAAHVGFLMALEELGVPVDAVAGASMGALVGAYYAAGWSPQQMDSLLHTAGFERRSTGEFPVTFGFKRQDPDPSVVEVRWSSDGGWTQDHLIDGLPTDWALMADLAPASAAARGDFDALFVPFRCVASDVLAKTDTTFASGDLGTATRASMTFPFFLEPVEVDGRLLFDGGMYNNFPSDVLFDAFAPDVIIGCNVSEGTLELAAQNPASQLEAMITQPANLAPLCDAMLIIEPETGIGTFDFEAVGRAVRKGYDATMAQREVILGLVGGARLPPDVVQAKRSAFLQSLPPFEVDRVEVTGLSPGQTQYASGLLRRISGPMRASTLERNLYLLVSDEHIASARPVAAYDAETGLFDVTVNARSERDLRFEAGGSLASRPVSFGHAGLSFARFGRVPLAVEASSTFGNFYNAFAGQARLDWHGSVPFALRPDFTVHRWNYVRSIATFFEDLRPSYLVMTEQQWGASAFLPTGTHGVMWLRGAHLETTDDFYPQFDFNPTDTTDLVEWEGAVLGAGFRRSSMTEKVMNRSGNRLEFGAKRFRGERRDALRNEFGLARRDTSLAEEVFWRFEALVEQYTAAKDEALSVGFRGELQLSDELLRRSYMGSIVQTRPFAPMPGASTQVLESFRAYNFVALGAIADLRLFKALRWRAEVHWYRPFDRIQPTGKGPVLDEEAGPGYMAGTWLVAQTPFGLATLGLEHYRGERDPWLFEFTLGHRVFNRSERR